MISMPNKLAWLFAAIVLLGQSYVATAAAFCSPARPIYRYVGDKTKDAQCTDNDIQTAINNTVCPNTTIVVTQQHSYSNQHLRINGKSLTLTGTSGSCGQQSVLCAPGLGTCSGSTQASPMVTLDGGGNGGSVLWITGTSHVSLSNLEIRNGCTGPDNNCPGSDGGGIDFQGNGSLTLANMLVDNNKADYGAGINVTTAGGAATLTINENTVVEYNRASTDGGGIRMEGTSDGAATLTMAQPNTWINSNEAYTGIGGGVEIFGDATSYIGSPGYYGVFGVIYNNYANTGGGVAVQGGNNSSPSLYIYSTDSAHPTSIAYNSAANAGGGVYVGAEAGSGSLSLPIAYLWDFQIVGNTAANAAAIYAHSDSHFTIVGDFWANSYLYMNPNEELDGNFVNRPADSVVCTPSLSCNAVSNNVNQDANGNLTTGSIILLETNGELTADRLIMRGNSASYAISFNGSGAHTTLRNCVIADNTVHNELVDVPYLSISDCTLAHNQIGGTVFYSGDDGTFELYDSIIDQSDTTTLSQGAGVTSNAHDILSGEVASLPSFATDILQGIPTYVNAGSGDYHLVPSSLGVDFAPAQGGTDLDGNPRDIDLPNVPNRYGPRDLGAYEIQLNSVP